MTTNASMALLVLLAIAVVAPAGFAYAADDKDRDPAGTKTIEEFKQDVKRWLMHETKDKKSLDDKMAELKTKYEDLFKSLLSEIREATGTRNMTDAEILAAIDYIVIETVKDEKRKLAHEKAANTDAVDFLELLGIPVADATCPATTDPRFKQVRLDIDGGRHATHNFNGGNDLYLVTTSENPRTCEKTYVLYFRDEDHPTWDVFYDHIRLVLYQRMHDIESFTIQNNRTIEFDETWSSTHGYTYTQSFDRGFHGTTTKTYVPGQTIYVSNTWNHMMDTLDTNGSLAKVRVP